MDRIDFHESCTLEEVIRKGKYFYEHNNCNQNFQNTWKDKKNRKVDQRKKGFKPYHFRNQPMTFQQNQSTQSGKRLVGVLGKKPRKLIHYWGCGARHLYKCWIHLKEKPIIIQNIQDATIMNDVAHTIPRIYVALEYHQAHQK